MKLVKLSLFVQRMFLIVLGVSVTAARKLMEFVSLFGTGLCLFLLSILYKHNNSFGMSFLLVNLSFFLRGFEVAGSSLNATDLTPSFCGVLYGMMNTLASIAG